MLLRARDPETGQRLSEAEVRANILTFIAAGHETTANCLTWSLYLLSQSPQWCERLWQPKPTARSPAAPTASPTA